MPVSRPRVRAVREGFLAFLASARSEGKAIAAYGAAAKGNTLLNYCGVTDEDIAFVVDKNPAKQNCLLPGSRIPVHRVERLIEAQPDHLLILPWNIKDEIIASLPQVFAWGGDFVTAVPEIRIYRNAV